MIHGDIDLTENMDFYLDKKEEKQLPAIPWNNRDELNVVESKENNGVIYNIDNDYRITFGSITYNLTNYTYDDNSYNLYLPTNSRNYSYDIVNFSPRTNTVSVSVTYSPTGFTYNDSFGLDSYHTWEKSIVEDYNKDIKQIETHKPFTLGRYRKHYMNTIESSRFDNHFSLSPDREDHRKKVFDKKARHCKELLSKDKNDIEYYYLYEFADTDRILDLFIRSDNRKKKNKNRYESRISIPWLRHLNSRVYSDYMRDLYDEDHDYSSYLTNRTWLRLN